MTHNVILPLINVFKFEKFTLGRTQMFEDLNLLWDIIFILVCNLLWQRNHIIHFFIACLFLRLCGGNIWLKVKIIHDDGFANFRSVLFLAKENNLYEGYQQMH